MVFDVNTYIGHWPFRQIRHNTAAELSAYLKNGGIDKACTSSASAIFYKDCMEGNRELLEEIAPHRDMFVPFCIINPVYTNWKDDFRECVEKQGFKGLELYPYYHNYRLTNDSAMELMEMATDYGIPVHLPCAVVNIRQRHWMDTMENLDIEDVKDVLSENTSGDFIISNGPTDEIAEQLFAVSSERGGSVYYDFARVGVFNGTLANLIKTAGAGNVIFGSVSPFQYIEPQFVKLEYLKSDKDTIDKISYGNLEALLFGPAEE